MEYQIFNSFCVEEDHHLKWESIELLQFLI